MSDQAATPTTQEARTPIGWVLWHEPSNTSVRPARVYTEEHHAKTARTRLRLGETFVPRPVFVVTIA
ncbi:hypothetical protein [Methylobacterium sp. 17Sr1-1]|uniref:hypothetical protein n=1 Tax=Methylobacterium sp. 17Sr1-1 TaxID=2202826 RepID=UPI000D703E0C|nr:hypothetical protein [Methylobacterium sp. 17Sr1-1]AWN51805.1 hypothetical protein DK412_09005 [Methylobacterium sp. 17Sr1-1]